MDKTIQFRDIKGFYTDEGKGNPIMLIHGFCEDGFVWDDFRKKLSCNFRLLIPDLPGYRNTEMTKDELNIDWMAEFVKAIAEREKIRNAIIIGHSMGGYVALALTEKYPGLPEKIGLFHSHCFADDEEKKKGRQKQIEFIEKNGTRDFVNELYGNLFGEKFLKENKATVDKLKAYAQTYPAKTLTGNLQAMRNRADRSQVLKSFSKPVLFILGKQDKAIPWLKSLEQCSFPKTSEVHILENAGHMGMYEEPDKTLQIVKEFVNLKGK